MTVAVTVKTQLILSTLACLLIFASCTSNNNPNRGEKYGGTLRINATDVPDLIFPGQVLKSSEQLIISQVYAGLFKYNPRNLELEPQLAKEWQISDDGLRFRVELVNNAYFHNDACFPKGIGRKIVASDIKYSIEQICHLHILSQHELSKQIRNIKGAEAIMEETISNAKVSFEGIKIINDSIVEFLLIESDELFIFFLASTNSLIFPYEAFDEYGFKSTVGSGAYQFTYSPIKGQAISLVAHSRYFRTNKQNEQLPFIDTIRVSFITSPPKELVLFEQNQLDLILNVNEENLAAFLDKNIDKFQSNPPHFVMKQTTDYNSQVRINIMRSNIQGLFLNALGYFDLSTVYLKEPTPQEIKMGE